MLLLSPALSHLALAPREGGAEAAATAPAPPTGNFRKMLVGAWRMADVAEAGGPGPQTHHQKKAGVGRQGEEGGYRSA